MARKKSEPTLAAQPGLPVEQAASVAYEAVRQLRITEGNRGTEPWEFLDNSARARAIGLAKTFIGPDPQVDTGDTEGLIYQRLINLLC